MIANMCMRLFLLAWLVGGLIGCVNVDINGYRSGAAPSGQADKIKCAGAC